jgi:predicted RNase H-like nuclease (RuvC/YqgF family)
MHDDVNEMKTDLKAEKKKTQNTKWTDDKKVSKEIMKLKKDLNKQKEPNKKLESGITNREKKISHLPILVSLHDISKALKLRIFNDDMSSESRPTDCPG